MTSRVVLVVAVQCVLATIASAQSLKTFPPGEKPFPVSVGAYLIDFQSIDESTLTHTIDAYLTLEWTDLRLIKGSAPELDRSSVTLDQIWSPNIEFMNEHTPRETANVQVTIDDAGRVKYEERFKAELSTDFDLRRFPFDEQTPRMAIESFRYEASELVLVPRYERELKSPGAFLPDWNIRDAGHRIDTDDHNPDRRLFSRYTFDIHVQRKVGYYVWNVFLPLAFITLLAWAVFFVTPQDLQTRTGVSVTALLTAIAFSLVISGSRPRVSYVTFMDAVFLNSYFLIFVAMASVVTAHLMIRRSGGDEGAERLSRLGSVAFPLLFVATNAAIVVWFLA